MNRVVKFLNIVLSTIVTSLIFFSVAHAENNELVGADVKANSLAGTKANININQYRIRGKFKFNNETLKYRSVESVDGDVDITLRFNEMVLTALIDPMSKVAQMDGFSKHGIDTQITETDREILTEFEQYLDRVLFEKKLDLRENKAADLLYRMVSQWAQTSETMPLLQTVISQNRATTSLCGSYQTYRQATHDGNMCNNNDANCTSLALVGSRGSNTQSLINGQWTDSVPDHVAYVYQRGECYGHCGGGCPSGEQNLTVDCLNHDQCVRNGHSLVSWWCNDEFFYTFDDCSIW